MHKFLSTAAADLTSTAAARPLVVRLVPHSRTSSPELLRTLTGTPKSKLSFMNFAGFAQDDWRITPKVIVNIGLRYMYLTPMKDANNNLGNFDPTSATGLVQQGQAGTSTIWKADPYDFEPRVGFAWDVKGNGRTVVRLGVGLVHETWSLETFEGQFGMQNNGSTAINAIPTAASISCGISGPGLIPSIKCPSSGGGTNALGSATFAPSALCWDPTASGQAHTQACSNGQTTVFPTATGGPKCGDGVGAAASPCDLMGVDPKLRLPYVVNYNLSVQHQLGSNFSVEVAYVGNHGYRLLNFADINQAPLGAAYCLNSPLTAAQLADACGTGPNAGVTSQAVQEARPYFTKFPYLGFINFITNKSYSNYNSVQVTLTKRMSQGLSFTAGYTYAHGLDSGSLNRFGLNPEDSTNLAGEYGNSDFDIRHRLTFTVTYNIPGKKGYGQMLEGWQVNSIVNYATAQPWQTFDPADNFSGTGEKADRWSIFGNAADFPSGKNSMGRYKPPTPPAVLRTHITQAPIPISCPRRLPQAPLPGAPLMLRPQPHWRRLAAMSPRMAVRSLSLQRSEPSATWGGTSCKTRGTTTWPCPYSRTSTWASGSAPSCGGKSSTSSIFPSPPILLAHPALSMLAIAPVRMPCSALRSLRRTLPRAIR